MGNEQSRVWDDESELWEHQGEGLTAGALIEALSHWRSLPVVVSFDDGAKELLLSVVEVGLTGTGSTPGAVVVTVVDL